jgi:hypothetical protein
MVLSIWHYRGDLTNFRVGTRVANTKVASDQCTTNPGGENGGKMELGEKFLGHKPGSIILISAYLNGLISPSLQLVSGVDESLNGCSIDMGTGGVVSM